MHLGHPMQPHAAGGLLQGQFFQQTLTIIKLHLARRGGLRQTSNHNLCGFHGHKLEQRNGYGTRSNKTLKKLAQNPHKTLTAALAQTLAKLSRNSRKTLAKLSLLPSQKLSQNYHKTLTAALTQTLTKLSHNSHKTLTKLSQSCHCCPHKDSHTTLTKLSQSG